MYGLQQKLFLFCFTEVVYIGSVCTEHVKLTVQMLKAGKHVLCEKPFSETADEIKMVNKLAKEKKLFFMEVMFFRSAIAQQYINRIGGVMGSVFASSAVDHGFDPKSNQRLYNWYLFPLR